MGLKLKSLTSLDRTSCSGQQVTAGGIVQLLLTHGARTTARDAYGWTALAEAVWNNQPATATLLLTASDATPGTSEKSMLADFHKRSQKKAIIALLQAGETR